MSTPPDPERSSGVRDQRARAVLHAIELAREAFSVVATAPERASELWQAASFDLEHAARADQEPRVASDLLWAAAALAMHGGDQARAASLSVEAVAFRAYFSGASTNVGLALVSVVGPRAATIRRGDAAEPARYATNMSRSSLPPTAPAISVLVGPRRPLAEPGSELLLGLSWLLKLRWGAVAGQAVALGVAKGVLAQDLPYGLLAGLVVVTALTNGALTAWGRAGSSPWHVPAILVLDVAILAAMLAAAGGASNPFTVFFLVHVALAALLLSPRQVWVVVVLTVGAFAALFAVPAPEGGHHHHGDPGAMSAHLVGMWIAYALSATFVAYSVGRVSRAIRERDRHLAELAGLAAQNERLATLSSFSANAAHELGTPLATIGLAAQELSVALRRGAAADELVPDADLVRQEVARCRAILADLSARAGQSVGEMPVRTTTTGIVEKLAGDLSPALAGHLEVSFADAASRELAVVAPLETLTQVLLNLVRNAFEAQEENEAKGAVELHVEAKGQLCFHVRDRGPGLADELRVRLGEPFVTTKAEQGGLGLGVYLARAYAERVGGSLRFHSRTGGGTDVELCLPRDVIGRAH